MFISCCNGPFSSTGARRDAGETPTFQSSEVTSLLLGTSCPPSRMQWRSTSWVELELLFSFRFQILAVESPELRAAERVISNRRPTSGNRKPKDGEREGS